MTTIETKQQYEAALSRIEELYRLTDENTPVDDPMMVELDMLGREVEKYEDIHYPIAKPSLAAVLRLRMYEMGISQKKLAEILHVSQSRVSDFLHGKGDPSLKTARLMSQGLNIDADIILGI